MIAASQLDEDDLGRLVADASDFRYHQSREGFSVSERDRMSYRSLVFALATFVSVPVASAHAQSVYVAPTLCYTNAPYTIADQYYGYQAAVLNIRAWPNGTILGVLANGTPVQVINVNASTGSPWAYVAVANGFAGWVFLPYLYCG